MRNNPGTKEWAGENINFQIGCETGCLYCYGWHATPYARCNKLTYEQWIHPKINWKNVEKNHGFKKDQPVMFPSTHNITLNNLGPACRVLQNLITNKNAIIVVLKACPWILQKLRMVAEGYERRIDFRLTITTLNESLRKHWEPKAPSIEQRIQALKETHEAGFQTSVSIEPFLDNNVIDTIQAIQEYAQEIWIGPMNHPHEFFWTKYCDKLYSPKNLQRLFSVITDQIGGIPEGIRFKQPMLVGAAKGSYKLDQKRARARDHPMLDDFLKKKPQITP